MAGKRNNISYVHDEPAFIKAFKQRTGYKEGPTVDAKILWTPGHPGHAGLQGNEQADSLAKEGAKEAAEMSEDSRTTTIQEREALSYEEDDRSDTEEEKPVVVVLKSGDLTEEQANEAKKTIQDKTDEEDIACGKITFKKPTKRQSEDNTELQVSSSKKSKEKDKKSKDESTSKKVKDTKLLSFDDDENDDDDGDT